MGSLKLLSKLFFLFTELEMMTLVKFENDLRLIRVKIIVAIDDRIVDV